MGRVAAFAFLIALAAGAAGASAATAGNAPAPQRVEIQHGEMKFGAFLYRPEGNGPFPAVVALHGCGGLYNSGGAIRTVYRDWGQRLAAQGFAVVYPDSHAARALGNQCGVRARAARLARERIADANAARVWFAEQSWAARDRISLLGWSSGGITALWTVRPKPVATSSAIRSVPALSQSSRTRRRKPGGNVSMPAAAWISGSMHTAATSAPCSARMRSSESMRVFEARSTGKQSGPKRAWNDSMPPTETAPSVSPWYACSKDTKRVRRRLPPAWAPRPRPRRLSASCRGSTPTRNRPTG